MTFFNLDLHQTNSNNPKAASETRVKLKIYLDSSFSSEHELITNSEKLKNIVASILDQENPTLSKLSSLKLSLNQESSKIEYNLNSISGSITATIPPHISSQTAVINKIAKTTIPNLDPIEYSSNCLIRLIQKFLDFIVSLYCRLVGRLSSKDQRRLKIFQNANKHDNFNNTIESLAVFAKSLKLSNDEFNAESESILNATKAAKDIYSSERSITSKFNSELKNSILSSLKDFKNLEDNQELSSKMFILQNHNNQEATEQHPVCMSYTLRKVSPTEISINIRVIEQQDSKQLITSFNNIIDVSCRDGSEDNTLLNNLSTQDTNGLGSVLASYLSALASYYDNRCDAATPISHWSSPTILGSNNFETFKTGDPNSIDELAIIYGLTIDKSKTIEKSFSNSKSFKHIIQDVLDNSSFSNKDSLELFSVYVHSYSSFILDNCKKGLLVDPQKIEHLNNLKDLLNELNSMTVAWYKNENPSLLSDVFDNSPIMAEIIDLTTQIEELESSSNFDVIRCNLTPVSKQIVIKQNQTTTDTPPEVSNDIIEKLETTKPLKLAIEKAKSSHNAQDLANAQQEIIECLSNFKKTADDLLKNKQFNEIFQLIPEALSLLPPPYVNEVLTPGCNIFKGLSRVQIESLSKDITILSKHFFESTLRLGNSFVSQDKMFTIIKTRATQHLLLNQTVELVDPYQCSPEDAILAKAKFPTSILKDNGCPFPIYSKDMVNYINNHPAQCSGYNITSQFEQAAVLNYLKTSMSNKTLQPCNGSEDMCFGGISFSESYCVPQFHYERFPLNSNFKDAPSNYFNAINKQHLLHISQIKHEECLSASFNPNYVLDPDVRKITGNVEALPSILKDTCTLELCFRALSSPGATLTVTDKNKDSKDIECQIDPNNLKDFAVSVDENRNYISQVMTSIPTDISLEYSKATFRDDLNPILLKQLKFEPNSFKIKDPSNRFNIDFKALTKPIKSNSEFHLTVSERVAHAESLTTDDSIDQDVLCSAFGIKCSHEGNDKVDFARTSVVNNISSYYSNSPGHYKPLLTHSDVMWLTDNNPNLKMSLESQILLKTLLITEPVQSDKPLFFVPFSDNLRFSHTSIINALTTCIHKTDLLKDPMCRRVIEKVFFQNGLLLEALASNPNFFEENIERLDKALFLKFTGNNIDAENVELNFMLLNIRTVLTSAAESVAKHLQKCSQTNTPNRLFGINQLDIDKKLKSLQSLLTKIQRPQIEQIDYLEWMGEQSCSHPSLEIRDKLRGYFYNSCRCIAENKGLESLGTKTLGLLLGSYLQNFNQPRIAHGYPDIDSSSELWLSHAALFELEEIIASNVQMKNEILSTCYHALAEDNDNAIYAWSKNTVERGIFKADKEGFLLSIFQGFNLSNLLSKSTTLVSYDELSKHESFKKIFGNQNLKNKFIITKNKDELFSKATINIDNNVIEITWNQLLHNPFSAKLIINNGDLAGEYDYSQSSKSGNFTTPVLNKGLWLNKDISKASITCPGTNLVSFNSKMLKVFFNKKSIPNKQGNLNLEVSKILNLDETLQLASNEHLQTKGLFSESANEILAFTKSNTQDGHLEVIVLNNLDIELESDAANDSFKIKSSLLKNCTINKESVLTASKALFLGSDKTIFAFQNSYNITQIAFSVAKIINNKNIENTALNGKIIQNSSGEYEVEASACGFYALALLAAEAKDYTKSLKFLHQAKKAQFNISESAAFGELLLSWNSVLKSHTSKKAAALAAKAFATGLEIQNFSLPVEKTALSQHNIHESVRAALNVFDSYSERVFKTEQLSVNILSEQENISAFNLISPEFILSEEELSYFKKMANYSNKFLSEVIYQKIQKHLPTKPQMLTKNELDNLAKTIVADILTLSSYEESQGAFSYNILLKVVISDLLNIHKQISNKNAYNDSIKIIEENLKSTANNLKINLPDVTVITSLKKEALEKEAKIKAKTVQPQNLDCSISPTITNFINSPKSIESSDYFNTISNDSIQQNQQLASNTSKELQKYFQKQNCLFRCTNGETAFENQLDSKIQKLKQAEQSLVNEINETFILSSDNSVTLSSALTNEISNLSTSIEDLFVKIKDSDYLTLNNYFPEISKILKSPWLYSNNDLLLGILQEYRNGSFNDNKDFEDKITKFLFLSIKHQQLEKASSSLQKFSFVNSSKEDILIFSKELKTLLDSAFDMSRFSESNTAFVNNYRNFLVGEYNFGFILRDKQKEVISTLLNQDKSLVLCPPGTGKSTAIAPMYSAIAASQGDLPVIVTTEELATILAVDLSNSNKLAFQQQRVVFNIDTTIQHSLADLLKEYNKLLQAKLSSSIILTTLTGLASLENLITETKLEQQTLLERINKEVVNSFSPAKSSLYVVLNNDINSFSDEDKDLFNNLKQATEKLDVLQKIKSTITSGKYLIDECDSVLDNSNWVNQALDTPKTVNNIIIQSTDFIFSSIKEISDQNATSACHEIIESLKTNSQSNLSDETITHSFKEIGSFLYQNIETLNPSFQKIKAEFQKNISEQMFLDFLIGCDTTVKLDVSKFLKTLNSNSLTQTLNTLKTQLTFTLKNIIKEQRLLKYGLDKENGCCIVPKQRGADLKDTKHADAYESTAFHFAFYLHGDKVCSLESFSSFFNEQCALDENAYSDTLKDFLSELDSIPTDNKIKMAYELFHKQDHWRMRFLMLNSYVFSKNTIYDKQIKTNSQDPFFINDSYIGGMSGTIQQNCLPKTFKVDKTVTEDHSTELTELKVCQMFKNGTESILNSFKGDGLNEILQTSLDPKCCAIINCGEAAENLSALEVVTLIKNNLIANGVEKNIVFVDPKTRQQMIWYFQDNTPVPFSGETLQNNTLAYYGSPDTRGTDFKLPSGFGLLIPGKTISEEDLNQSIKRLRKIGLGQTLQILLSNSIIENVNQNINQPLNTPVKLGNWLQKVQCDTIKSGITKNLKQRLRDCQITRLQVQKKLTNLLDLDSQSVDLQSINPLLCVVKNLATKQLFDLNNSSFIQETRNSVNSKSLISSSSEDSLTHLIKAYDSEEATLKKIITDLELFILNPKNSLKTILDNLNKGDLNKQADNIHSGLYRNIATSFLSLPEPIKKATTKDIFEQLTNITIDTATHSSTQLAQLSSTQQLELIESFLSEMTSPEKSLSPKSAHLQTLKQFFKTAYKNNDDVKSMHMKTIMQTVMKSLITEKEMHLIFLFETHVTPSIEKALQEIKACLTKINSEKEAFVITEKTSKSYSKNLQDSVTITETGSTLTQGDLATVVSQVQQTQAQQTSNIVLQQSAVKQQEQATEKSAARVRHPRHVNNGSYEIMEYSGMSYLESYLKDPNKNFLFDLNHATQQLVLDPDPELPTDRRYLTCLEEREDKYGDKFYNPKDVDQKLKAGFRSHMFTTQTVINSIKEQHEKSSNGVLTYVMYVHDKKNNTHKTLLISKNDAYHLAPQIVKDQAKRRAIAPNDTEALSEYYKHPGLSEPRFIQSTYEHLEPLTEEQIASKKYHLETVLKYDANKPLLSIEVFSIAPNSSDSKPFKLCSTESENDTSVLNPNHKFHLQMQEDMLIYSVISGKKAFSAEENDIMIKWLSNISPLERSNLLNLLSVIHKNKIPFLKNNAILKQLFNIK